MNHCRVCPDHPLHIGLMGLVDIIENTSVNNPRLMIVMYFRCLFLWSSHVHVISKHVHAHLCLFLALSMNSSGGEYVSTDKLVGEMEDVRISCFLLPHSNSPMLYNVSIILSLLLSLYSCLGNGWVSHCLG